MTRKLWAAMTGRALGAALMFVVFFWLAIFCRPPVADYPQAHMSFRTETPPR